MRKGYLKLLAGVLVVAIISTTCFLVYRSRDPYGPIKGVFKDTVLDSSEPIIPSRPFTTKAEINEYLSPLQRFLISDQVSYQALMDAPELESKILNAASLEDLVSSQAEVRGLTALSANVSYLLALYNQGNLEELPADKLEMMQQKLDELFELSSLLSQVPAGNPMKGTWTRPDQVVLRWTPGQDWIPEQGYDLYRVLDGETVLLAEGLGSPTRMLNLAGNPELADYVKSLHEEATLDAAKMQTLGIQSAAEFKNLVYGGAIPSASMMRVSGDLDYNLQKDFLFSIPTSEEKVPLLDSYLGTDLHFASGTSFFNLQLVDGFALGRAGQLQLGSNPGLVLTEKEMVVGKLMNARKTLVTMALTNEAFANNSGFGYEDNLEQLEIALNQELEYIVVPLTEGNEALTLSQIASGARGKGSYSLTVLYGVETPVEAPLGLDGYGADNVVSLRWEAPETEAAKALISGFHVERRGKDEAEFTRINETPVAISYAEEAEGILCEAPVFFEDYEVKNGDEYVYRIQALDIFGRVSDYSASLEVKVHKVKAPLRPVLDELTLSTRIIPSTPKINRQLIGMNKKIEGSILPIASSSPDTELFVVYRSKALGTGSFDAPQELVRIKVGPYLTSTRPIISANLNKAKFVIRPSAETRVDTLYYDNTIEPGYFYKYWVAAVDSWGNESEWSESRTVGFPLDSAPQSPENPEVTLTANLDIKAPWENPPGFLQRYSMVETLPDSNTAEDTSTGSPATALSSSIVPLAVNSQQIGYSVSDAVRLNLGLPNLINLESNNMPQSRDVHDLLALTNDDLSADGTARVSWVPYAGDGLQGYAVYRAYADGQTGETLEQMTKEEVLEAFEWELVEDNVHANQLTDKVEKKADRLYLYFIFLIPQETSDPLLDSFKGYLPGGWISMSWSRPQDPQISGFRVYRASVPYFQEDEDLSSLEWTLVGDNIKYAAYSEKVDQTYAHYFYFKVTSVSVWGVESQEGAITKYRVPATAPPQPPAMLVPFSKKETNEVNWMGVPHACKYVVYRHKLPRIADEDLKKLYELEPTLFNTLFNLPLLDEIYRIDPSKLNNLSGRITGSLSGATVQNVPNLSASKAPFAAGAGSLKTFQLTDPAVMMKNIQDIKVSSKQDVFQYIEEKYGVLALAPYTNLSIDLASLVVWEEIAQIDIPLGEESARQMNYLDTDVQFGETYLYTVKAWNDDNLGSGSPEPVSVFTRKGSPFPPVTVQAGSNGQLKWSAAKDPNLSVKESSEHIAGYLVYRSNTRDGDYYQASPLLDKEQTSFIDVNANLSGENWYRVRVVDTAGYISDFSEPILITVQIDHIEKDFQRIIKGLDLSIPDDTGSLDPDLGGQCVTNQDLPDSLLGFSEDLSLGAPDASVLALSPTPVPITPVPITPVPVIPIPIDPGLYISDTMTIAGFKLTEVSLKGETTGSGEAVLNLKGGYAVPVNVTIRRFDGSDVTDGTVTEKSPFVLGDTGINIKSLNIGARAGKALVTGYALRSAGNLFGDLNRLELKACEMTPDGLITVYDIPVFHYQNLTFTQVDKITLNFGRPQGGTTRRITNLTPVSSFISLHNCLMETSLNLETMDNKGLEMRSDLAGIDKEGRLSGTFVLNGDGYMRTVIPAGLGIAADNATLVYAQGNVDAAKSSIAGRVYLPFKTFHDTIPAAPPSQAGMLPAVNQGIVDRLSGRSAITAEDNGLLDMGIMYMAQLTQANSLLVIPQDMALLEQESSLPFSVTGWDGKGFLLEDAGLSPALIPLYDPEQTDQTSAEMGVTPYRAALDLRRDQVYSGEAPEDTKKLEWMGIVIKDGNVSLPPRYVQTEDNQRVRFNLTPGELLYDQNGFCYQNQAYTPEGVPVNFGDRLGGFTDVIVYNIVFDLYNNIANLEIEGSVAVPLFHRRVNVRLYKDKDSGEFVCTVAETEKFDPAGDGTLQIKVLGGYLDEKGLHMDGTLDFTQENSMEFTDVQFNDLIVPADMTLLRPEGDSSYGRALLDMPYLVSFHDFPMEIRALSMVSVPRMAVPGQKYDGDYKGIRYNTTLTLWGGMQLSDNLALNAAEDTDRIVIENMCNSPAVKYDATMSQLNMTFEDYAVFQGVGKPILVDSEEGLVEYDTSDMEMAFNAASSLLPCKDLTVNARIGYDKKMERSYFAIALHYEGPPGIPLGFAEITIMNGMLGYNMDLDKNSDGTYKITADDNSFINMVDSMPVNRSSGGNYFFAVACNMSLGYDSIQLGELRNVYMVVEKGPSVEMGGYYYGPASIASLGSGSGLKEMGFARIGYYHPSKHFKFALSLYDLGMYGFTVSGDLGFEMNPDLWELRIGYPNTLVASMGGLQEVGFGLAIRNSELEDYIRAKAYYGYDTGDVSIGIVYVRGYLTVGGEGEYNFTDDSLYLHVYLNGGVQGGVKALGKRFNVISLMLTAEGTLVRTSNWRLSAHARIHYHVDLWLDDISGSVGWNISTSF